MVIPTLLKFDFWNSIISTNHAITAYRLQINVENSPNRMKNKVAIQMNRAPVAALGIDPYTARLSYNSQYPDIGKEYMGHDLNQKMAVNGKAEVSNPKYFMQK